VELARSFEFSYDFSIPDIPETANRLDIWIPIPQSDPYQQITDLKIETDYPYGIHQETVFGNKMLYVRAEENITVPANIRLSFKAKRQTRLDLKKGYGSSSFITEKERQRYLGPNSLVPTDGIIAEAASQVVKENMTDLEKVRAIYEHVTKTVAYDKSGEGWGRGDAIYACNIRKGNCTDFHSLFIGMARASGIPARFAIGFPLPADKTEGDVKGYHCWAEFYIPDKGWIPVDSSEAFKHPEKHDFFFGNLDADRVQFTMGRDIMLEPQVANERLNYFIYPYVLLDGEPLTDFNKRFTFKDIVEQG
jgi:transglutaminase-like putative cysteine protease